VTNFFIFFSLSQKKSAKTFLRAILRLCDWNTKKWLRSRVTRLDEFSPVGYLQTLGSVLKSTEVSKTHGPHFTPGTSYVLILTKKWFGQQFGRFFITIASGHTASYAGFREINLPASVCR
jgi:hypothetical protein